MEEKWIRLDEINIYGLISQVLKNLWVVALVCLSALMCFTSVSRLNYKPEYTSTATFMVSAKDSTSAYNSLTTTQNMASVFVKVFQSNVLREKIQEQMPETVFEGTINVATVPETNLLIIKVTDKEPDTAFRAMNLLVENYSAISDYLFTNAQLEVIKDPAIPVGPSNPLDIESKYMIVFLVAAAVALGGIIAIYLLRDTVKTPKAVQRKVDARLLRTINHEIKNKTIRAKFRRKNIAPLITNSLIKKEFIEDNLSLCSALEYHARKRSQKVIMVTSVGENEGKSTIAANLALALAEKDRKVVLLDCDFRKPSLHKIFELTVDPVQNLTSYLMHTDWEYSSHLLDTKKYKVTLGLSQHSGKSITKMLNNGKLNGLLKRLREEADYVILDTPPMLAAADAETIAAMADTALLVVRADYMPTSAINEGLDRLRESCPEICGVVLNNYHTSLF